MCPDIIFQILLPHSRPYDVTSHHVTAMSHASSSSKRKEKKKKKKTKSLSSQKIKEKENKNCSCPKHPITVHSIKRDQLSIW